MICIYQERKIVFFFVLNCGKKKYLSVVNFGILSVVVCIVSTAYTSLC